MTTPDGKKLQVYLMPKVGKVSLSKYSLQFLSEDEFTTRIQAPIPTLGNASGWVGVIVLAPKEEIGAPGTVLGITITDMNGKEYAISHKLTGPKLSNGVDNLIRRK